jgi:hypothetical protein
VYLRSSVYWASYRVKLLEGGNVREGFLNRPEFEAICQRLPDVGDIVRSCTAAPGAAVRLRPWGPRWTRPTG